MRKTILICLLLLAIPAAGLAQGDVLRLSTTTGLEASGLLDVLLPEFKKDTGVEVQVFYKSLGSAIRDAMNGEVDAVLLPDPAQRERLLAKGFGLRQHEVMRGDFLIVGPDADPATARSGDAAACLRKIAASDAVFASCGDDSVAHVREQALWRATGLPLKEEETVLTEQGRTLTFQVVRPEAMSGFVSVGDGVGNTLVFAEEKQAYTLADRATYVRYKYGRPEGLRLESICEGDNLLADPYGLVLVNPEKFSHVRLELAETFSQWLVSGRGQQIIADYRLFGRQLFFPDAKLAGL